MFKKLMATQPRVSPWVTIVSEAPPREVDMFRERR